MNLELHAWRSGLKTGAYYVRTNSPTDPLSYGVGHPRPRSTPLVGPVPSAPLSVDAVTFPSNA